MQGSLCETLEAGRKRKLSDDETDSTLHQQHHHKIKKRRLRGACDTCRKRKIKCDSAERPGKRCSNCETSHIQCTHDAPRQPKRKEAQQMYLRSLEERLSKMKHVFGRLHPDNDVESLLDMPLSEVSESRSSSLVSVIPNKHYPELSYHSPHLSPFLSTAGSEVDSEEDQDLSHVELAEHLKTLFVDDKRFFGPASTYMFAHHTMRAKTGTNCVSGSYPLNMKTPRRHLYWEILPWELTFARSQEHSFVYPEPDLLESLVALYFEKSNAILPVLHKPTFLRSINSGLHHRDSGFGMTLLLVCAVASRFSCDRRVLFDGDINNYSSGWKYYSQVPSFRNGLFEQSTLYDLQCYVLSALYLMGTSTMHAVWPLIGLGIRFAQEKGLHRRNGKKINSVEDELAKRVFWSLIFLDRWTSACHGRPCAIQDEEFDLEYPVECDDEYWEAPDSEHAFQQPPGKPCTISSFICMIKLAEMLGFALRTLYATKKAKDMTGVIGSEQELQVVAELDFSMNQWKDNLPHYLRWDPDNQDDTFFSQSIALYSLFYQLQIQVHRNFMTTKSTLSLAVCTNAARSTAHILEVAMSRGTSLGPDCYVTAFVASLVLLLAHWTYQESESGLDFKTTMGLVQKLFLSLKDGEKRFHFVGRYVDILQTLDCLSDQRNNPPPDCRRELHDIRISSRGRCVSTPWEPTNMAESPLQRQSVGPNPEPTFTPSNWDVYQKMMNTQHSIVQNFHDHPTTENTNIASFLSRTDFLPSDGTHNSLTPDLQVQCSTEGPAGSGHSDSNIFSLWSNLSISFNSHSWDNFLRDGMTPEGQLGHDLQVPFMCA